MEDNLERPSIFGFRPTRKQYLKYFNILNAEGPLYVITLSSEGSEKHSFYLEREETPSKFGVCRVFYRQEDVTLYANAISMRESVASKTITVREASCAELVDLISRLNDDIKVSRHQLDGVHAVASTVEDEEFQDVDIFWTSKQNAVV